MGGRPKAAPEPKVQRMPVSGEDLVTSRHFAGGPEERSGGGLRTSSGGRESTFLSGLIQKLTGRSTLGGGM